MSVDAQLREYEQMARTLLAQVADQVTVRGAPIIDAREGSTALDLRLLIESEDGNRRVGAQAELVFVVWSGARSENPELATTLAESNLSRATDVLYADNDLAALLGAKSRPAEYQRDEFAGGDQGSYSYAVQCTYRIGGYRTAARPPAALGVNVASAALAEIGAARAHHDAKVVEILSLSVLVAPATVRVGYANLDIGDRVELLDADGTVRSVQVSGGHGDVSFSDIDPGEYRARVDGTTSQLTALVVSA